jgi:hypothetical protein|nr:MAG TPA_asm: endonuclease-like protein [Caudoviricetes sp.]
MMNRDEMSGFANCLVKEEVLKWVRPSGKEPYLSKPPIPKDEKKILNEKYKILAENYQPKILEEFPTLEDFRVCYRLKLEEIPRCSICGEKILLKEGNNHYLKTCGKKSCLTILVQNNLKNSIMEKYGVENISQLESIKKKKEDTMLKHYGVRHLMQDPNYRKQKEDELLEAYGVRNVSQLQSVKDKKKATSQKNYGSDTYFTSEEGIRRTKETLLKKYGVDNVSKLDIIKEKKIQTTLKNWGVENPFQAEVLKTKSKETCLKKYGAEYASQNPEVRSRIVETNKRNHGGTFNLLLPEVLVKAHSYKYLYDKQYFDSKEELAIYIYCKDHGIPIERSPLVIEYNASGGSHKYVVDLKIDGKLYEFKGGMMRGDDGTWIPDPWKINALKNDPEALEKEYIRFAEKQKCAIENNVSILTEEDVQPYIDYCISKFDDKKWYRNYRQERKII